jgi:hypothetical protein
VDRLLAFRLTRMAVSLVCLSSEMEEEREGGGGTSRYKPLTWTTVITKKSHEKYGSKPASLYDTTAFSKNKSQRK